jgi:exodeoxyribonuclease VII small subunit
MGKRNLTPPKSFEDAIKELETLLGEIEAGDIGLEDAIARYERGAFLIQHCRGVLNTAERQIEQITTTAAGEVASEPTEEPQP